MSEQVSTNWLSEIQMFDVTTSTKEGSSALCDLDGDVAGWLDVLAGWMV
jgi:hypothetical protein